MSTKRIYDISMSVHPGMLIWPGNAPASIDPVKRIADGGSSNLSEVRMGTHTGTHVDAPRHFIDGAPGVHSLDPETLIGPTRLVQLGYVDRIDEALLRQCDLKGVRRLLLGTGNSILLRAAEHTPDYAYLTEDGARFLVDLDMRLIGVDYLSIEEFKKEGHPVHHILLSAGIIIVEGLVLNQVPAGDYELLCLPLKLAEADGAPARVFLRD